MRLIHKSTTGKGLISHENDSNCLEFLNLELLVNQISQLLVKRDTNTSNSNANDI